MYLTRANRHCTKNKSDVKSRKQNITSCTLSAARSDMNWCDGVTLGERMDFCGTDFNNEERSSSEQTQLFTKRPKYHLITGSDVLQRSHVLGRRLMFHGLASSLSFLAIPHVHLFSPFPAISACLCLNLFCSSRLSSLILSDEDPSCPPLPPALLHGGMYANVARVQKWKLDYSHSRSSLRQCSRKMKKEKKKKKRGKKSRSIVP